MLYSRFCIKKMGIPFTLIILQQLDTITFSYFLEISKNLLYNIVESKLDTGAFGFDGGGRGKSCRSSFPTRKTGSVNINANNEYAYAA